MIKSSINLSSLVVNFLLIYPLFAETHKFLSYYGSVEKKNKKHSNQKLQKDANQLQAQRSRKKCVNLLKKYILIQRKSPTCTSELFWVDCRRDVPRHCARKLYEEGHAK